VRTMRRIGMTAMAMALAASAASGAVSFEKDGWDAALRRAAAEKRPVMVELYAEWCGVCKMLERNTWGNPQVGQLARPFVSVRVDAEKGEGVALARRFGVRGYPTIVFLSPDGREVHRESGYVPPSAFPAVVRTALEKLGSEAVAALADAVPEDLSLQLQAARVLARQKQTGQAAALVERAAQLAARQGPDAEAETLLARAWVARLQARPDLERQHLEDFLGRHPAHEAAGDVRASLAQALEAAGDLARALELHREAARQRPESVAVLNGFAWFCATHRLALDEALPAALQAVQLSSGSAGVLDTLAEVHHARGEHEQALAVIEQAIENAPEDAYYLQQRDRFLAAQAAGGGAD
jgi:thioredoxin-like negative regulator of GroEL